MRKLIFLVVVLFLSGSYFGQSGPWQSPVKICTSANGTTFTSPTIFQDSSGVPSIIRLGGDTLMAAFQWFPAPMFNAKWDKIAVKYSFDGGTTWTAPTSCTFTGVPGTFQRPFDPSIVKVPGGIRMYFSDGNNSPPPGGIDSYSAFSVNGINYAFEVGAKYNDATKNVIDPCVIQYGGTWFYNAWSGTDTDGAYRATSTNGTSFTVQPVMTYDGQHLWLGNYCDDGSLLRFYGCGTPQIWFNASTNGTTWGTYVATNIMGADPTVTKNLSGTYVMLFTGPPSSASIKENSFTNSVSVFPNPVSDDLNIRIKNNSSLVKVLIKDSLGKTVYSGTMGGEILQVNLSGLLSGIYVCTLDNGAKSTSRKITKN